MVRMVLHPDHARLGSLRNTSSPSARRGSGPNYANTSSPGSTGRRGSRESTSRRSSSGSTASGSVTGGSASGGTGAGSSGSSGSYGAGGGGGGNFHYHPSLLNMGHGNSSNVLTQMGHQAAPTDLGVLLLEHDLDREVTVHWMAGLIEQAEEMSPPLLTFISQVTETCLMHCHTLPVRSIT